MLENLSKNELLELIILYDKYIQEFFEEEVHEGMIPVCIEEFYNNEYQEINRRDFKMKADIKKVKEIWEKLQDIISANNYKEFEIAYLITERLDNVISDKEEITKDVVEKVEDISQSVDTLLNEYVNDELDILEKELNEKE